MQFSVVTLAGLSKAVMRTTGGHGGDHLMHALPRLATLPVVPSLKG